MNIKEIMEELWDKHSEYINDDLYSLQTVAGRSVLTESDYKKLVMSLIKRLESE